MLLSFKIIVPGVAMFAFCFLPEAFSQKFMLPPIPAYDSIAMDGKSEKTYFFKSQKVFEKGYNTGGLFHVPFFAIGGGEEDSCYAYFNGKDHESYDFYYMDEKYIINEKFSENSKKFAYRKFTWDNVPIETGNYLFIREMYNQFMAHNTRYKVGKWTTYDTDGKVAGEVDYDRGTINGKKMPLEGELKIVDSLVSLANRRIKKVYGKKFASKYIQMNWSRSGYYEWNEPRPEQPGGKSFLKPAAKPVTFVDLSYDIVIGEERFNVIQFRISRNGVFLGKTHFPDFATEYFYLTQGLDSRNKGKLHRSVLNFQQIALEKGLDINSKAFNVRMEYKPVGDFEGELSLVLEQVVKSESTDNSFTNYLIQYIIDPWTGAITERKDEQGVAGVEGIGGGF